MSNKTAVEFLIDELRNHIAEGTLDAIAISKLKMHAKEMEKEQIEEAWKLGNMPTSMGRVLTEKDYYNETYK